MEKNKVENGKKKEVDIGQRSILVSDGTDSMDRKILMIIGEREGLFTGEKSLNSLEGMNSSSQWKDGPMIKGQRIHPLC